MPQLTLNRLRNLPAPAPSWRWETLMPSIPTTSSSLFQDPTSILTTGLNNIISTGITNLLGPALSGVFPSGLSAAQYIAVEAINFEHLNIESVPRHNGYTSIHFPGFNNLQSVNIAFYETEDYLVTKYLRSWQRLVIDKNGNYGVPSSFKQNIVFRCYGWSDTTTPKLEGTLVGCWPTTQSDLAMDYTTSGRVVVSCAFAVDDSIITGI